MNDDESIPANILFFILTAILLGAVSTAFLFSGCSYITDQCAVSIDQDGNASISCQPIQPTK